MNRIIRILSGIMLVGIAMLALSCASAESVSYDVVKNYFFRNDAEIPASPEITTREQFDSLFGAAAFMGKGGQPTAIDFDRQFVIAVVLPETDIETALEPVSLTRSGSTLTFIYAKTEGEKVSYTMRPILLIAADKADEAETVVLQCD